MTEEEKNFLKNKNIRTFYKRKYKKIISSVNKKDTPYLEYIINYLFNLKEDLNQIIHLNELKFQSSFIDFKKNEEEIKTNNSDDLMTTIKKINDTLKIIPRVNTLSYKEIINYTIFSPKGIFMDSDDKMKKLLCFLNIELTQIKDICEKYESKTTELQIQKLKIQNKIQELSTCFDSVEYNNLNKKYKIKSCYDDIIKYFDYQFEKKFPDIVFDKKQFNLVSNSYDKEDIKSNEIKNKLNDLILYDNKLYNFMDLYFKKKMFIYMNDNKKNLLGKLEEAIKTIEDTKLNYLKIQYIQDIIKELKLYNFDFKDHFNDNNEEYAQKHLKIDEKTKIKVQKLSFENFIDEIKKYIGNVDETINIGCQEPNDLILELFLYQAGFK